MSASAASTFTAKVRIKHCGALLAGAIEASLSIIRGAGGSSISRVLQCARVVPQNSPAFPLFRPFAMRYKSGFGCAILIRSKVTSTVETKAQLEIYMHRLARMFSDGRASPYDVDLEGNTLLHVRVAVFRKKQSLTST